jgi:hypothetical protein
MDGYSRPALRCGLGQNPAYRLTHRHNQPQELCGAAACGAACRFPGLTTGPAAESDGVSDAATVARSAASGTDCRLASVFAFGCVAGAGDRVAMSVA